MSTTETPQEAVTPPDSGMRLHEGDDWKVPADTDADGYHRTFEYRRAGHEVAWPRCGASAGSTRRAACG